MTTEQPDTAACTFDPTCEFGPHAADAHPCGKRLAEGVSTSGLIPPVEGASAVPLPDAPAPPPLPRRFVAWRDVDHSRCRFGFSIWLTGAEFSIGRRSYRVRWAFRG